jgi:hypothetical protein
MIGTLIVIEVYIFFNLENIGIFCVLIWWLFLSLVNKIFGTAVDQMA